MDWIREIWLNDIDSLLDSAGVKRQKSDSDYETYIELTELANLDRDIEIDSIYGSVANQLAESESIWH